MAKLPKYTLEKNEQKDRWDLVNDASNRTVKTFDTKADAIHNGALEQSDDWNVGLSQRTMRKAP